MKGGKLAETAHSPGESDHNSPDGVLEVVPNKGRDVVVSFRSPESVADSGLADGFNIRGREAGEALHESVDRYIELDAVQILPQQPFAVRRPRGANFDLLRESSASKNGRVDPVQVVRGSNQENIVLGKQLADLGAALFDELSVMRALHPIVAWHQIGRAHV